MAGGELLAAPRSWRLLAGAAGAFLLWRGLFGRSRGRMFLALGGVMILRRAFGTIAAGASARPARGRRAPEVVEVKSPAELEPGIASASPRPTFSNRVDRPRDPSVSGSPGGAERS